MLYAFSKKYNYCIGWTAKCGCTMFRKLFLILHKDELKEEPCNGHNNLHDVFPLPTKLKRPNQFVHCKHVVLCRNPYRRAVSMFTNKVCRNKNHHHGLHEKVPMKTITFRNFIYGLKKLKELNKIEKTDVHIIPQSFNYKRYEYTTIIKLEEFNENITKVYTDLGLFCLIPQIIDFLDEVENKNITINRTKKNDEEEFIGDKEYPIETSEFPEYKYFYDEELFETVYNLYKDDFENFEYKKYEV